MSKVYDADQIPPYTGQPLPKGVYYDPLTEKYVKEDPFKKAAVIFFTVGAFVVMALMVTVVWINT